MSEKQRQQKKKKKKSVDQFKIIRFMFAKSCLRFQRFEVHALNYCQVHSDLWIV